MTEPEWKAELLEDRSTSLAASGSSGPGAPLDPRWRVAGIVAALALALAVIVLYSPGSEGASTASVSPSVPDVVSAPTAAPLPTTHNGPCATDPVRLVVAPDPSVPDSLGQIRVPPGGLAAFVVPETRRGGSIVVAGLGAGSGSVPRLAAAQVVATYSTTDVVASIEVAVVDWSSDGDAFLVMAHELGATGGDQPCTNLFLIRPEVFGVRQMTQNGPGMTIDAATLAPSGDRVAYVQDGVVLLRSLAGDDLRLADCPGVGLLQWTANGRRVLATCEGVMLIAEPYTGASRRFEFPDGWDPLFASWADHEHPITLVANEGGELGVLDFDSATGRFERRPGLDLSGAFVQTISPGGRWLVGLRPLPDSPDLPAMFAVDLATDANTEVPVSRDMRPFEDVAWLADGDTLLYSSLGVLYASNLATGTLTEVGSLPTSHFIWANRAP